MSLPFVALRQDRDHARGREGPPAELLTWQHEPKTFLLVQSVHNAYCYRRFISMSLWPPLCKQESPVVIADTVSHRRYWNLPGQHSSTTLMHQLTRMDRYRRRWLSSVIEYLSEDASTPPWNATAKGINRTSFCFIPRRLTSPVFPVQSLLSLAHLHTRLLAFSPIPIKH